MKRLLLNQAAVANRRPVELSGGSIHLPGTLATGREFTTLPPGLNRWEAPSAMITLSRNSVPLEKRRSGDLIFGIIWFLICGMIPLFYVEPLFFPRHLTFAAVFVISFMVLFEGMIFLPVWKAVSELRRRRKSGKS